MTPLKTSLAGLIALAGFAPFAPAQADVGSETAELLNLMYADTREDCGSASRPAFLCSGVLFRGTTPSTAYQFYSISPASQRSGGVSASYLRKDGKFKTLAFGYKSGFIFDTVLDNPATHIDYKVLCAFPIDAASGDRQQNGCGDSSRTTAKENFCDQMGITTAEQWLALYRKPGAAPHSQQCAFDVRQGRSLTASAFYQNLRAMSLLGTQSFNENNEVILAPWTIDVPRSPSILASFYLDDSGLEGARLSQIQWYTASKSTQVLPAIQMKLPQSQTEDAKFVYDELKQAIHPVTEADACTSYTGGVKWTKYTDARLGRSVNSMTVTLNDCTRKLSDAQLNNFVNKLVSTQYLKPEWQGDPKVGSNSIASVRQQLQCYLATSRNLPAWGVEPSRPYLTKEKTLANGCNNF